MTRGILTFGFLLLLLTPVFAQRLPEDAIPQHYQLTFTPDFNTDTFAGEEIIDLKLTKLANSITLNAAELKFNSVSVEINKMLLPAKAYFDADREMATINAGRPLRPAGSRDCCSWPGVAGRTASTACPQNPGMEAGRAPAAAIRGIVC